MRTVLIDFNESVPCKQTIIGYVGEHNATEIIVTPPDILASNEAVTRYIIAFVTGGKIIHSEPFNKAETLAVKLWKQLTLETVMGIQLEAYDDNQNFIGKSEFISGLRFLPSACGDDTVADTDNPDIVSAIAANTSARHTHTNIETLDKLGDSNGSLTYYGKAVGGDGGSPTIKRATAMLDFSEGYAIAASFGGDALSFNITNNKIEEIGANSMIVDVGIVYDGTEYRGANIMRISGIINGAVKVFPFPQEDISVPGDFVVCVLTGCDTNSDLFIDINGNNSLLTTELIIYYCEGKQ